MSDAPADRILDVLGDPPVRQIMRALNGAHGLTQSELVASSHVTASQSIVSRSLRTLHVLGLVTSDGGKRSAWHLRVPAETSRLLLAANNLGQALADADNAAQSTLSNDTRRGAIAAAEEAESTS